MSMEAGVVIGVDGEPIHWHVPPDRSVGALPDSRPLWDVLWEHREDLLGFAHSHPGGGMPGPSYTDVTTFRAIEKALGRRLLWWITSSEGLVICQWRRRSRNEPGTWVPVPISEETAKEDWQTRAWLKELRRLSYTEVSHGSAE